MIPPLHRYERLCIADRKRRGQGRDASDIHADMARLYRRLNAGDQRRAFMIEQKSREPQ